MKIVTLTKYTFILKKQVATFFKGSSLLSRSIWTNSNIDVIRLKCCNSKAKSLTHSVVELRSLPIERCSQQSYFGSPSFSGSVYIYICSWKLMKLTNFMLSILMEKISMTTRCNPLHYWYNYDEKNCLMIIMNVVCTYYHNIFNIIHNIVERSKFKWQK